MPWSLRGTVAAAVVHWFDYPCKYGYGEQIVPGLGGFDHRVHVDAVGLLLHVADVPYLVSSRRQPVSEVVDSFARSRCIVCTILHTQDKQSLVSMHRSSAKQQQGI